MRENGSLGNVWPLWGSIDEYSRSGYQGPIVIQYRERNSPYCRYRVDPPDFDLVLMELVGLGAYPAKMYCSPWVDTSTVLLHAEVVRLPGGLAMHYSTEQTNMRDALRSSERHAEGLAAKLLLDHFLDFPSREWLDIIVERTEPGIDSPWTTAIELTVCDRPVGTLGWNTIFWEARSY